MCELLQMGGMGGGGSGYMGGGSGRPTTSRAVPNPSPEKFHDYVVRSPTKEAEAGAVVSSVRGVNQLCYSGPRIETTWGGMEI